VFTKFSFFEVLFHVPNLSSLAILKPHLCFKNFVLKCENHQSGDLLKTEGCMFAVSELCFQNSLLIFVLSHRSARNLTNRRNAAIASTQCKKYDANVAFSENSRRWT